MICALINDTRRRGDSREREREKRKRKETNGTEESQTRRTGGDRGVATGPPTIPRRRWRAARRKGRRNAKGFPVGVRAATEAPAASTASFQCVDSVVQPKAHSPTRSLVLPLALYFLSPTLPNSHSLSLAPHLSRPVALPVALSLPVSLSSPPSLASSLSLSLSPPAFPSPTAILASSSRSGAPVRAARARELSRPKAERARDRW